MIPKFRAWIIKENLMSNIDWMNFTTGTITRWVYPIASNDKPFICSYKPDEYILMQSTGLKDKNGVEIFEGDIVEKNYINYVVKFGVYSNRKHNVNGFYLEKMRCYEMEACDCYEPIEIIGNIHQNPELLEKNNG